MLRQLGGAEGAKLRELPRAEISFNYLGQLDQALPEKAQLRPARESAGREQSPRAERPYLLDLNARVAGVFDVTFDDGRIAKFGLGTVAGLLEFEEFI